MLSHNSHIIVVILVLLWGAQNCWSVGTPDPLEEEGENGGRSGVVGAAHPMIQTPQAHILAPIPRLPSRVPSKEWRALLQALVKRPSPQNKGDVPLGADAGRAGDLPEKSPKIAVGIAETTQLLEEKADALARELRDAARAACRTQLPLEPFSLAQGGEESKSQRANKPAKKQSKRDKPKKKSMPFGVFLKMGEQVPCQ